MGDSRRERDSYSKRSYFWIWLWLHIDCATGSRRLRVEMTASSRRTRAAETSARFRFAAISTFNEILIKRPITITVH